MAITQQEVAQILATIDQRIDQKLGPAMQAQLDNTGQAVVTGGIPFVAFHVAEPAPLLPVKGFTQGLNDRVISITNQQAGQQKIEPINFDLDSAVYAITAAVYKTTLQTFPPTGFANSLDTFTLQFKLAQGRQYQTSPALGSAVCGDAKFPRYLGMPAWRFPTGTVLNALVTPLVADLRIDITLWAVELTPWSGSIN